jgi:dolichyl-phosphate-mannose-protein mannosyltransferase
MSQVLKKSTIVNLGRIILIASLWTYATLTACCSLMWPLGRDQGTFAWVADTIVRGGAPYRDAWELKGPSTHLTYALVQLLFGPTEWGIRLFDFMLVGFAAYALWRLLKRFGNSLSANLAAPFMILLYYQQGFWHTAQPDSFSSLLAIIATSIVFTPSSPRWWHRFLAGLLIGIATSHKLIFVLFLLPCAIFDLMDGASTLKNRFMLLGWLLGGAASITCIFFAWLASQGVFAEYAYITFSLNRDVHKNLYTLGVGHHLRFVLLFLKSIWFILPFTLLGLWTSLRTHRRFSTGIFLMGIVGFICTVLQHKYYSYHWFVTYGPIAIFSALGIASLDQKIKKVSPISRSALCTLLSMFIVALIAWPLKSIHLDAALKYLTNQITQEEYYREFDLADFSYIQDVRVAGYLNEHTKTNDQVLVWGGESLVNYLSRRQSPTRFGFNYPLTLPTNLDFYEQYRREFINELTANQPVYVVIVDNDTNNLTGTTSKQYFTQFGEFQTLVKDNYIYETTIDDFILWRKK